MYDWGKPTQTPAAPVTAPVETQPAVSPDHPVVPLGPYQPGTGQAYRELTQSEVDKLDPIQRALRGIENIGHAAFGKGNGPILSGAGDVIGAAGNLVGGVTELGVVKPVEVVATGLSHIPTSYIGGDKSADSVFNQLGDYMKANDPEAYRGWLAVKHSSDADFFGGGNQKADFNTEAAKRYDALTKEGVLGSNPTLSMGISGTGSLGGILSHFLEGAWGVGSSNVQGFLGNAGFFDPSGRGGGAPTIQQAIAAKANVGSVSDDAEYAIKQFQSGAFTEQQANDYLKANVGAGRNRVQEAIARLQRGGEISALERTAAQNVLDGTWTEKHANDALIAGGQSITRNPVGQLALGALTDPLTYAMPGVGAVAKAAAVGGAVAEGSVGAANAYEHLGTVLNAVTSDPILGRVARAGRAIIDPFTLIPHSTVTKGLTDLFNGASTKAVGSAYGYDAISDVQKMAREAGIGDEVNTAIASIGQDKGRELMATEMRDNALRNELGNELVHTPVDVEAAVRAAPKDVVTRMSDYITTVRKNVFSEEDYANLGARMAKQFGGDVQSWITRVKGFGRDTQSALHAVTAKLAETDFINNAMNKIDRGAYKGDLPLEQLTILNPENIDNVTAQALLDEQAAIIAGKAGIDNPIASGAEAWNKAALRYDEIAKIGHATGNKEQLAELVKELEADLKAGQFHRRALPEELADPALKPLQDFVDRNTIDGQPLWNIGFRPDQEVSWGLKADRATGKWIAGRAPSIDHTVDAVYQNGFADTTRNVLGQIIGPAKASAVNRPIDVMEAFARTTQDVVSGRRLVKNMENRFHANMAERLGVPKQVSKDVWRTVTDVAGLNRTTVRGLPVNESVWAAIEKALPADLVQSGKLNVRNVMDALLDASEGDLRIMGVTSKMTQRMRNMLRHAGIDSGNQMGDLTVTKYNQFRYIQPTFMIQKVTDAPYFMGLHGIMPVGSGELTGALADVRRIEENMGFTGTARDFAMDMPERAVHSNWTEGMNARVVDAVGGDVSKIDRIQGTLNGVRDKLAGVKGIGTVLAPDRYIANNMTKDLSTRMGSIVKDALTDIDGLLKQHPDLAVELRAEQANLEKTFADFRATYSEVAGRTLSDNEVGLKYIQEQLASARRIKAVKGGIDTEALHHEMSMHSPSTIGEVQTIYPDQLAAEMGYSDAKALREAVQGRYNPATQQMEKGILGLDRFKEDLAQVMGAHPDYVERAANYFGGSWQETWDHLARPIEQGGMDISPRAARAAQDLIRGWAKQRGMDPWEYMSQIIMPNLGAEGLDQHMKRLADFLNKGGAETTVEDVMDFFLTNLDPSAQNTLIEAFGQSEAGQALRPNVPATEAAVPAGFTTNPHVAASGTTSTLPRDGLFHVTTAKDAVTAEGFRPSTAGGEFQGFGSKGDTMNAGRVSILTNKARSQTYMDRLTLGVKAARGEVDQQAVLDYFKPLYDKAFGEKAPQIFSDVSFAASTPEDVYQLVKNLDGGLIGGGLNDIEKAVKLTASFNEVKNIDPSQIGMVQLASRVGSVTKQGLDAGELTLKPEDLHVLGAGAAATPVVRPPTELDAHALETYAFNSHPTHPGARPSKGLDAAFEAVAPSTKPATYYRSVSQADAERMLANPEYTHPGYMSTAESYDLTRPNGVAYAGKNDVVVRVEVPAGTRAINVDQAYRDWSGTMPIMQKKLASGELVTGEHLLPFGQTFDVSKEGDQIVLRLRPSGAAATTPEDFFRTQLPALIRERAASGVAHANPEIEAYFQQFSKWAKSMVQGNRTRSELKGIVNGIPTAAAAPYNRSQALIQQVLHDKIRLAQQDAFMLAEMGTNRNVLMRSINHPFFGIYPASYMWGKVLPVTAKALARNPFGLTYDISKAQQTIATQREYDPKASIPEGVDKSAVAFLLGYLTPSLPWETMQAQTPPWARLAQKGDFNPFDMAGKEFDTMSPERWYSFFEKPIKEIIGAAAGHPAAQPLGVDRQLQPIVESAPGTAPSPTPAPLGPTKGADLSPILETELQQLQSVLGGG